MKPIKKICLINPPCEWVNSVRYSNTIPYQGILSIASFIRHQNPDIPIEILDGNILNLDEIKGKMPLDCNIYGISSFVYNHTNAIQLSCFIKQKNPSAIIVLGGGMPTALPDVILNNHPFIDYIISHEGEHAFHDLAEGKPIDTINSLIYRKGSTIIKNPVINHPLDAYPFIQYDQFVNLDLYYQNADRQNEKRKLPIYTSKGCKYREASDAYCVFCSEMYSAFRKRDPNSVWGEIIHLRQLGACEVLDAADNFLEDLNWFNEFYAQKAETDVSLKIYSRAESLDEDTVKKLKDINVSGILIGIESNSDAILRKMGKTAQSRDNENAVLLLKKHDIMPRITLILGGEGETEETARETLRFAENYLDNDCWITCSILKPLPGSRAYKMLVNHPATGGKYVNKDILDYAEMSRDWVNNFCRTDYDLLLEIEKEIVAISEKRCSWDNNITLH